VARNGHDTLTIAHDNMLSLRCYSKAGFFERPHGVEMIDARDLRQGLDGNFDFANVFAAKLFF